MIKLYNTATRQLASLDKKTINLYTCGPTVYSFPQIGNWATYLRWDILVRTLKNSGHDVNWVMNITDVGHLVSDADAGEDKLEKGARQEGKTAWEVAKFYTDDFINGMKLLNITPPNHLAKATDHIPEQITLIKQLEGKGYTYRIDDGIYFETTKFKDYGKMARLHLDDLRAGARVEINPQKHSPTDFALWKFSPQDKQRDMEWASPWGNGFPGWHIECSAMAMKYLGKTLDIHAGGIDHIPVHHTNEIAQSEAATGQQFANIWLHGNFITVNGTKLSKSLGNSFNLHDIIAAGYQPAVLRVLFLQGHYRSETNFTWDNLATAAKRLESLQAIADLRWQLIDEQTQIDFAESQMTILRSLQNDLNTPQAFTELSRLEQLAADKLVGKNQSKELCTYLEFINNTLGINLLTSQNITTEQKNIITSREFARSTKDFKQADKLRSQLISQKIAIRDTANGPIWQRQN